MLAMKSMARGEAEQTDLVMVDGCDGQEVWFSCTVEDIKV
jgi:hypothetical protein